VSEPRPILLSSCARAATAAEAAYRIDAPVRPRQGARVVALDDGAATLVRRLARQPWHAARFYTLVASGTGSGNGGVRTDIPLHRTTGTDTRLADELDTADVAIMIATTDGSATAAEAIGRACARRGIMTAGLILGERQEVRDTVLALRPHAQVLLITGDDQDAAELLTALRA
jgi:hypothetical protein